MELSHEGKKFTDEELREEVDTMMIAVSQINFYKELIIFKIFFLITLTLIPTCLN